MEDKILTSLLLDYYGELLTDYQRKVMRLYNDEDLSMSEVAEVTGTTRQAVADIIARVSKKLSDLENKLGLVTKVKEVIASLEQIIESSEGETKDRLIALMAKLRSI